MANDDKRTTASPSGDGERMVRATVARGHTVTVPHPTEKKAVGVHSESGKQIMRAAEREYGPNSEVELPASEVKRLRELGYLVDPDKIAPAQPSEGSSFAEVGVNAR